MDELKKEEIFSTLNRVNKVINNHYLIKGLSEFVEIKTAVVGGAVRDLYLNKPIKDIDISISLDFTKNLKVEYPKRENYRYNHDMDYDREFWDCATAEATALKHRNYQIIEKLKTSEYSILHEFLEKDKDDLRAIDAIVFLIRKIIEENKDYSITQIFDKTTVEILVDKPKLNDIPYENMGLCAVIALKDKHTNYPIELLFTTDQPTFFIECFDFNICKIHMENIDDEPVIIPSSKFLKDIENKTITYTPPQDVDEKKINKSLLVRYERFEKKFPDFKLEFELKDIVDDLKILIERTVSAINLSKELKSDSLSTLEKKAKKTVKI